MSDRSSLVENESFEITYKVTCHSTPVGGKRTCFASRSVVVEVRGGSVADVPAFVRVAETTYMHLSTYDDSLVTDNDDSCCGKFISYKVPGEGAVTSVGDVSSMEVPVATV